MPHTAGHRRLHRHVGARPRLLHHGLRRRLVADGPRDEADGSRPWPEPFDTDLEAREGLAFQLVEGIALLGKVDWRAKGLEDLGRPDGFHERQVDRWTAFLERIKGRELPGFDEAAAWLRAHKPIDYIPGLMHGDYQFANVMYETARRRGWPPSSTGRWAPSATPSSTSAGWCTAGPTTPRRSSDGFSYVDMQGMPSRDEVLAHYSAGLGPPGRRHRLLLVLAKWKLAVVLEQGFQRAGDDEKLLAFGPVVLDLMAGAAELAETTDYRS